MHLSAFALVALLCAACLSSPDTYAQGADDSASAQTLLRIVRDDDGLRVSGNASSSAHETILRESARMMLGDAADESLSLDLRVAGLTPPGWSLITEMVLRAVLTTRYATADVTPDTVLIHGVTANPDQWARAILRVDAALLADMSLEHTMLTVDDRASYQVLCRRQFLQLARDNKIEYFNSGATINSDAYRSLDALVELAVQCPGLIIEVTGHTDASGEDDVNLAISKSRALAVVDYMVSRGLPAHRLSAKGAGSSDPLVAETSRNSRRQNRRVEFRLIDPG